MMLKIIKEATGNEKLKKNEYYALMVTDTYNKGLRPKEDYIDFSKGWLGWERPTDGKPYISKDFHNRNSRGRGTTYIVEIKSKSEGVILDYCAKQNEGDRQ